eukprot:2857948-Alexandrium_andersonii.AAC.1
MKDESGQVQQPEGLHPSRYVHNSKLLHELFVRSVMRADPLFTDRPGHYSHSTEVLRVERHFRTMVEARE